MAGTLPLNGGVRERLTDQFYAVRDTDTVAQALDRIRASPVRADVSYFYVVDAAGKLVGVLPARKLITAAPGAAIRELMSTRMIALPLDASAELVNDFFATYRFLAIPVVDGEGRIAGVLEFEAIQDAMVDEFAGRVRVDAFHLLGLPADALRIRSLWKGAWKRLPWLGANIAGGLLSAAAAGLFQGTVERKVALASFIPLVLLLAESVGMQATGVMVGALERRLRGRLGLLFMRELGQAALIGAVCGALVGAAVWAWTRDPGLAFVLAPALLCNVTTAALLGGALPLLLRALRVDPSLAGAPVVLAVADPLSLAIYLGLATAVVA